MIERCNGSLHSFANSLRRSQSWKLLINYAHRNTSSQSEMLSAMRLARSGCDAVGLAITRSKGSESAEETPDVESFMVHCHLELRLRIMHMLSATEPAGHMSRDCMAG